MTNLYRKLVLLLLFGLFITSISYGQYRYGRYRRVGNKMRFGLKGGLNISGLKYVLSDRTGGTTLKSRPIGSFQVGVVADLSATSWMSLQSGITVSGKGAKIKQKGSGDEFTYKMHPWYLEIPAELIFKPRINYGSNFYFGAGPYIAFALGGKGDYDGSAGPDDYYSDHSLKFGNGANKDMRMIDLGMNILAGFVFNQNLMLGAQYGLGLRNLAPKKNEEAPGILKNRNFSLTLTILFGRKPLPYY